MSENKKITIRVGDLRAVPRLDFKLSIDRNRHERIYIDSPRFYLLDRKQARALVESLERLIDLLPE